MILQQRPVEGTEQNRMLLPEKRKNILLSLLITGLFFLLLSVRYDFYYDLNDDTAIRDIVSGIHSGKPSAHSIQMLYPLSWVLSICYTLLPQIPWFGMFLHVCQMACVFVIGYELIRLMHRLWSKIAVFLVFLLTLSATLLYQLVFIQYTVVCGMLMVAAVFRIGRAALHRQKQTDALSAILLLTAFQLRTEMCLLLFPFVGLVLFAKWLRSGNVRSLQSSKKYYSGLLCVVLLMGCFYVADEIAYCGSQWKDFMRFFDQRTVLYDFIGFPQYDDNQLFYEENHIGREEYQLLENYNFSLDENWNTASFEKLIQYRKEQVGGANTQPIYCYAGTYTTEKLTGALWSYKQRLLYNRSGAWYYVIAMPYLCIFMIALLRRKYFVLLQTALLFMGRSALWIYLLLRNRMPDRIMIPLYFIESIVLLSWLIEELCLLKPKNKALKQWWAMGIILLFVVVGATHIHEEAMLVEKEFTRREQANEDWQRMQAYCSQFGKNYYVLDVYSTTAYSEKIYQNVDNSLRNYDLCGGWLAKSPLTAEKLAQFQITNLEKALAEQEGVYFIAAAKRDIGWLQAYYDYKEYRVNIEKYDTIADSEGTDIFVVYQVHNRKA